jgi:hypothetical protein
MSPQNHCTPKIRHDGWTAARRTKFLDLLAAGFDVRASCKGVGLSREAAYKLRRREPAFAQAWDDALRAGRETAEQAWLAMLPDRLRRTVSELSGECKLRGAGSASPHPVTIVARA